MNNRQRPHYRRSKRGRVFRAGRGHIKYRHANENVAKTELSQKAKKEVVSEFISDVTKNLKKDERARIPDIGIIKIKTKKAVKGGGKRMMFGKEVTVKARPARKVIKFVPASSLKKAVL